MSHAKDDEVGDGCPSKVGQRMAMEIGPPLSDKLKGKWYVLAVLFLAAVLSYTDRLILNVLVEPLKRDLRLTDTQISLLQGAAFAVVYSLAALPLGRLADRVNRKRLLLVGIGLWTAGTAACAFAADFRQLFGARVIVGLGEAGLYPAGTSLLIAYFPIRFRATAIGIFFMGSAFGAGTAVFGGGVLLTFIASLTTHFGSEMFAIWRRVLIALVLPGLVVWALLLAVREPDRAVVTAAYKVRSTSGLNSIWNARKLIFPLLLAQMFQSLVDYGSSAWMPALLVRKFALTPSVAGIRLGYVVLAAAAIGPSLGGLLSDRLETAGRSAAKPIVTSIALFSGIPLIYFCFSNSSWISILLFGMLTLVMGVGVVAAVTAIQDAVDDTARGTAIALQSFFSTIVGLGCGPTLVAIISDRLLGGPEMIGIAIAIVAVPGLACGGFIALRAYWIKRDECRAKNVTAPAC